MPISKIFSTGRSRLRTLIIALLYFSIFFRDFKLFLGNSIGVTPVDIATIIIGSLAVSALVYRREFNLTDIQARTAILLAILIFWHGARTFGSPQPVRALTLVALLVRDFVIVGSIWVFIDSNDLPRINQLVFRIAASISAIMLPIYLVGVIIGPDSYPLFTQTIHSTNIPRAQWFIGDPNFFGMTLLIGILAGFDILRHDSTRLILVGGLTLTVATLFTTVSRSALGLFLIVSIVWLIGNVLWNGDRNVQWQILTIVSGMVSVGIAAASLAGIKRLTHRFAVLGDRLPLWEGAIRGLNGAWILGRGLRAPESIVGKYIHNTYISLFVSTGTIGLTIYVLVIIYIAGYGFRKWVNSELGRREPWFWGWVALIGFNIFFTYGYMALAWFIPAMFLVGRPPLPNCASQHDSHSEDQMIFLNENESEHTTN